MSCKVHFDDCVFLREAKLFRLGTTCFFKERHKNSLVIAVLQLVDVDLDQLLHEAIQLFFWNPYWINSLCEITTIHR